MENTYVVYCEEYYFSLNTFSTILKKKVYNVSENLEVAEEIKNTMDTILQKSVDSKEIDANNEIITTYEIKVICLEGNYSIEEARNLVINDDYTWGKVGNKK